MSKIQTDLESQTIDLSTEAFEAFCDDISGMFGIDINCSRQENCTETIEGFKKRFRKLTAVNSVKAKGALNGTFQLIFDQGGLFTLSGVIIMLPEKRILEKIKLGSISDVESMNDAVKEVGNLLVGSWERIFRNGLKNHGHFLQTGTFIGTPWDKPKETIGLADNEEFIFVSYQMTVQSFPTFQCGVIFPKNIFDPAPEATSEKAAPDEKQAGDNKEQDDSGEARTDALNEVEQKKPDTKVDDETNTTETTDKKETETGGDTEQKSVDVTDTTPLIPEDKQENDAETAEETEKEEVKAEAETKTETKEIAENVKAETKAAVEVAEENVSETKEETSQPPADISGHSDQIFSPVFAENIMEKNVVWCDPDDIVHKALTKMQQHKTGYLLVGIDGTLEGIVSKSDISGAISPYIRDVFAKWCRPQDVATLQIKLKWIMSKPVRIIKQDTSVENIIETMRQFGGKCLPVVDQNGQVRGMVTVFDIFKVLNKNADNPIVVQTIKAPALAQI